VSNFTRTRGAKQVRHAKSEGEPRENRGLHEKIEAKNTFGETGMPDAKKRRGEATASDSDKSPRTNEANVGVSVDADGDANMRSEQV